MPRGPQRDLLQKLNPLCQIPTLALENGEIMTESAAIALMILDPPSRSRAAGRTRRASAVFSVC
ncbi:glutathione S-transferase [Citrobacter koseri]|uniref:Glutathione S-transferase n=1 Tax=Citrobacter koseri TaxID=545 RepID=A0A2X2W907_CITKO|nr:glutathione S-transferase [Citrobacter koseri]